MSDTTNIAYDELDSYLEILNSPVMWMETFLVNPVTRQPFVLNYVQSRFFSSKRKNKAIRVHRRAGKSFGLVGFALWYAMTHEAGQIVIICPDQRKVELLFNTLDEFVRVSPGISDSISESRKSPSWRKFKNGATIAGYTTGARSNSKGESIRGATADVVIIDEAAYLNEDDWDAITPIMIGDEERMGKVLCFVSSTPTDARGQYYMYCTRDCSDIPEEARWDQIHIPVTENKAYTPEKVAIIRSMETEDTFKQEWMAEFPDIGEGVFKRSYIDRAGRAYAYYDMARPDTIPVGPIRTMGVDWDKVQASPNIVVLELDQESNLYRLCYREEINKSAYSLTVATQRVIELNEIFKPTHIYVDRGYGEQAVETMHLYGLQHPHTELARKVRGVSFSENVEVTDPASGEIVKKKIKPYMVNLLVKWFEDNSFIYPGEDKRFIKQLEDFKVVAFSDNTVSYSSTNEHIIDACCLAAYAMHENFTNPFAFAPAIDSYLLPIPQTVAAHSSELDEHGLRQVFGAILDSSIRLTTLSRRNIPGTRGLGLGDSSSAPMRKSF